jgi:predicted secreted protein
MIQNGTLIKLLLNNVLVAKLLSLDVTFEREMLDITTKDSSNWKENQSGAKSFSLSCEGLVVDPYNKNMIPVSENFRDSRWVKTGLTISPTLYAAPDGFIKANRTVSATTADTIEYDLQDSLFTVGLSYTYSVWIKAVTGTVNMVIKIIDDGDDTTNAITATTTWQRFSVTHTIDTALDVVSVLTWASTGEVEIFGAQVELGNTVTTYEPTGNTFAELFSASENGTKLTALVSSQTSTEIQYSGDVFISNLSRTASVNTIQTFSCDLTGTSLVTKSTI